MQAKVAAGVGTVVSIMIMTFDSGPLMSICKVVSEQPVPDKHLFCFTAHLYSSMVPGNLPSQLEILSTGQTYYEAAHAP